MGMMGFSIQEQKDIANMLVGYANSFEKVYEGNETTVDRHPEIKNPEGKYLRIYTKRGDEILALAERVRSMD